MIVSKGVGHKCVSYVVSRELLCNRLPVLVECENPTGGRSWFFTLDGLKVFHVKIVCFYFVLFHCFCCLLLSHKQAVRTGAVTICEKLAMTFKNTIHPPSCVLYS